MNRFGTLKTKILQKLTEAYASGNKSEIKKILTTVTKNKDFRDLYLFYEEIENKYFEDKEDAEMYLKEIRTLLIDKSNLIREFTESLDKKIGEVSITENELYSNLDTFIEKRRLRNADKYLIAKRNLIEHLTTKKEKSELVETIYTENENLLHTILTNNFNVLYNNTLNEGDKTQLAFILAIPENELKNHFDVLKEQTKSKITNMLVKEQDTDVTKKLLAAEDEITKMPITRLNYYKLLELNNGL